MSTLHARPAYTRDELERLYPKNLQLQLVQVVSTDADAKHRQAHFYLLVLPLLL